MFRRRPSRHPRAPGEAALSPHFRFARPEEIPELARLVAHSFPGPARPLEWREEQLRDPIYGGGPETLIVGEDAGRPVAACQIHPLRQWIAGEQIATAGVGTVAVSPMHRKRGLAAALVTAALRAARERGDVASALYPFRVAFYQKLGYGLAGRALQYQIPPEALPESQERLRVELLEGDAARAEALVLYNLWARTQTGQIERGKRAWTRVSDAEGRALAGYRAADGTLEGYGIVVYRADLPRRERFLEVEELVWTSAAARRGLYAWLASLGDQWEQILLRALPSHRLGDWIREPRLPPDAAPAWGLWTPAATLLSGPMFRLLDLPLSWARRSVAPGPPLALTLEVEDAQFEENRGSWRLALEDGRATLERGTGAGPTLRLHISTLSRLFVGSITASAALEAGLLACDRPDRLAPLDAALALPEPWTFDRF